MDELDTSRVRRALFERRAMAAVKNLRRKNCNAQYYSNREAALTAIIGMIPQGAVVARGDSLTVEQVGVVAALRERGDAQILFPFERDDDHRLILKERHQRRQMAREAFMADVFLTGTNAVTMDGKLVNVDCWGNRVAPMIFGPDKVIVVAGINKIVKDADAALRRIRDFAAPMNAQRHHLDHPDSGQFGDLACVRTGTCIECNHDDRICCTTTIMDGTSIRDKGRINVVLVGEELGI